MSSTGRTRRRTSPQGAHNNHPNAPVDTKDLPPPRQQKAMRDVSAPLSKTRLSTLIYILVLLTALLGAYYTYRLTQYKTNVGGWWNLALGRKPESMMNTGGPSVGRGECSGPAGHSVEDKIEALAEALGMPKQDLASAIAGAVRQYVPPASLSSVAAKETGPAVEVLVSDETVQEKPDASGTGVVEGMVNSFDSFVGMDEP
ncbi:hypothetical protein CVT24_006474 [Panaeolus cyanescens]|uniref:Uncharacterized protein n=1 Tax=Panaeolus cyanescens TaxID=181874 RepID=A0A409VZ31_9AGAR|nr:hypothetical protein CVT24_006474 [Panaeolus cyanescens]